MKKTIAVLLALVLCAGCALAEDNDLTGTWVVEKMESKEEFISGNRLEISFTEQGRMSFSAFESFRYESDESSLTLTAGDFGLDTIVSSLLGEKVDYTYEFLSPVVSAIGSRAVACTACIALSFIVGIPSGRNFLLPAFGIYFLRRGFAR